METSTYGSELVVTRVYTELIMEMKYKLIIIEVLIDGRPQMLGNNESVVTSCSITSSTLNNKNNAIADHQVREAVGAGVIRLAHIPGKYNPDNILTNTLVPHQYHPITKELLV